MTASEIHGAVDRAEGRPARARGRRRQAAVILAPPSSRLFSMAHATAFRPVRGAPGAQACRLAHAAPPLNTLIAPAADPVPVWPAIGR